MRIVFATLFCALTVSCASNPDPAVLQKRIDSLEVQLAGTYRPGFGDFMSGVQVHHAKLWFAGKARNWPLAKFELQEIAETIEAIQRYLPERRETVSLGMLKPAMDTMNLVIQEKRGSQFEAAFRQLTAACNGCHKSVNFSFNIVTEPSTPPFSNQHFEAAHE